ncbi:hypothetical protein [Spirosoma sp. KNUC1025]|uniref:hypothetical protein n=1 Tax=Spirosoma sp. KNUC1025 TaxID=2894082 RepID=UPI003863078D|nr:hypothetical protein LN737_21240 [Spirosoma sp. KNUC1025]
MKRTVVICFALFFTATLAWSQHTKHVPPSTVYVPVNTLPEIDYKYHDGTVELIDGNILKGRFQYNGRKVFTYRASSQATRQRIGFSMIRRLSLSGSDTLVTNRTDSTVFLRFGHQLYRLLADGATVILDRRFLVDEDRGKIGRKLYVVDANSDLHTFTSLQKLNNWFYTLREKSGKQLPDTFLNQNEIVKAVARLNEE